MGRHEGAVSGDPRQRRSLRAEAVAGWAVGHRVPSVAGAQGRAVQGHLQTRPPGLPHAPRFGEASAPRGSVQPVSGAETEARSASHAGSRSLQRALPSRACALRQRTSTPGGSERDRR